MDSLSLSPESFPCGVVVKNPPANAGDVDQEDPLEKEKSNPIQYACLENPMGQRSLVDYSPWDRKSWTQLSN